MDLASLGWTHSAPYHGYGYGPLRFGVTALGEWEHNNNSFASTARPAEYSTRWKEIMLFSEKPCKLIDYTRPD